jgi:hypothetical protein
VSSGYLKAKRSRLREEMIWNNPAELGRSEQSSEDRAPYGSSFLGGTALETQPNYSGVCHQSDKARPSESLW